MKEPISQVYGQEEINAGIDALQSGHWTEGWFSNEFKKMLSKYLNRKFVLLTNSGSSANLAAIMSLTTHWIPEDVRLKEGDEIITTALCFPTTVSPIIYAKCVPVFVDVDETWNIDCEQVEQMITQKTKAIIVASNLGNPFNIDRIVGICKKYNLWLINDNCDSLGSTWNGNQTGSFGDIATSSFYPAHQISTGEGGAVYTDNPFIFRGLQSMINWGRDCYCNPGIDNTCKRRFSQKFGDLPDRYDHKNVYTEFGFNLKMNDIQAAIGVQQLKKLGYFIEKRRYNFGELMITFAKYNWFELPVIFEQSNPCWFGYVVKLKDAPFTKDAFIEYLEFNHISTRAFFCGNITKQPLLWDRNIKFRKSNLKNSDDMMNNSFWLRVHPGIDKKFMDYTEQRICKFLNQYI